MENGSAKPKNFTGLYIFLTIIIMLQLFSIFLDIVPSGRSGTESTDKTAKAKRALPDHINKEYREQLLSQFLKFWNEQDAQGLYSLMGESAKSQLVFEDFESQCKMLFNIGQATETNYINYEYTEKYLGSDVINLYYTTKIGSQRGSLCFTLLDSEGGPQVMRFDIRANP